MQQQHESYKRLAKALYSALTLLTLLDTDSQSRTSQDAIALCNYLLNPNFRIAVFGPFNHGKSTLLNAMLGSLTLPIDLIPTTGAAIIVKYGTDLRSRIILKDGLEIYRSGTEILKKFAILDGDRRMRGDVASVEVYCPHPFLATGVEFVDLPGTNDREEQDKFVCHQLLSANLVIHLLDARKLMTLGERENLRDWFIDRGIKTVIFVVNFLNLLEPEEQKQVQNRLRFVAESFRAHLPANLSNIYRVDALPALRARLKGDVAAAQMSGLANFEAALQSIVANLQQNSRSVLLVRVKPIADQIYQAFQAKIEPLKSQIKKFVEKENAKHNLKRRVEELIKKGFTDSVFQLRTWLNLLNLRKQYQADAAVALAQNEFKNWENAALKKDLQDLQLAVTKWTEQAYEFFHEERLGKLLIPFPPEPKVTLPPRPNSTDSLNDPGSIAVGGGIGWLLGGPVGAAVVGSITYFVNKNLQQKEEKVTNQTYHQQVAKICVDAVDAYLSCLSHQGLSILAEYEQKAERVIRVSATPEPQDIIQKRQELRQLQNGLNQFSQEFQTILGITLPQEEVETEKPKQPETQTVYRCSGKGIKEEVRTQVRNTHKNVSPSSPLPPINKNVSPSPPLPPISREDLEAKFRSWEIDEEIAQMKANMGSPGFHSTHQSQANQNQSTPKTPTETEKIARAYTILGLKFGASPVEVKQMYRILVKKWHPDLFVDKPQQQKQAQEQMRLINEAYTVLSSLS